MKEVKFNLDEDILFQIAMMTYAKCNSEIATIYDHLGEEYGYSDLQAAKEYELRYEKDLLERAVAQLQDEYNKLIMLVKGLYNDELFPTDLCDYMREIDKRISMQDFYKFIKGSDKE